MASIGDLIMRVVADLKGFSTSVEKEATKAGEKGGKAVTKGMKGELKKGLLQGLGLGAGLGVANAVGNALHGVTEAMFDSIKAASDLSESMSKAGVVFGDSAVEIDKWSDHTARSLGLSKQAALEAAGTLGNLLLSMGKTGAEAAEMSRTMVNLAGDLASFNNVDIQEVLMAMRSGLTGEIAPLRRFGVNLTEAALKAKGLELGVFKGTGVMDAAAKSAAAYALILEQTTTAQGDFARTAGGLANQQRILNAEMEDTSAKVGQKILPFWVHLQKQLIGVIGGLDGTTKALVQGLEMDTAAMLENGASAEEVMEAYERLNAAREEAFLTNSEIASLDRTSAALQGLRREVGLNGRNIDDNYVPAVEGAGAALDDLDEELEDNADWFKKWKRTVTRSADDVVRDLAKDAGLLISNFFDPIHTEQDRHDARVSLSQGLADLAAAADIKNAAKRKKATQDAQRDIIQSLEDEARALEEKGNQGKLTTADIKKFTRDSKAAYDSMGKKVPKDIQKIIDKLRDLRAAERSAGAKITVTMPKGSNPRYGGGQRNVDRNATGGPVWKDRPSIVGERRPELFVPSTNGYILPRVPSMGSSAAPAAGDTVNINVGRMERRTMADIRREMKMHSDVKRLRRAS